MATFHVHDQTDENFGTTVTQQMFGLNALNTVTTVEDVLMNERYQDLGVTNLRFPGGSVTEWYFDISDVDGGSYDKSVGSFEGNENTLAPFSDFIESAAILGTSVTLVMPTINGLSQSAGEAMVDDTYGQRVVDQAYLDDVAAFTTRALEIANAQGVTVQAFEIGNEFWGSGRMTASEYGNLAAAMSQVISDTLADLGMSPEAQPDLVVQTTSAAGLFSPREDTTFYVDETTGFVHTPADLRKMDDAQASRMTEVTLPGQGNAREQAREIIAAFNDHDVDVMGPDGQLVSFSVSEAANAIDGVVDHYYVDGGFDAVNTEEQFGFNQLDIWNIELDARDVTQTELDYYITEWNTRKNGALEEANNRGLQQVSMDIEIFYEMVTHDVTAANFWPVIFNYSNSGTLVLNSGDALTIAGEGFALMSESLVGLDPLLDFHVAGDVAIHGYGDTDTQVYFLSERSGSENQLSLDLSDTLTFESDFYQVSWTELSDGGAGGTDEMADPIITETEVDELMRAEDFEEFLLTMQAWSVVRLEVQGVDAASATPTLESESRQSEADPLPQPANQPSSQTDAALSLTGTDGDDLFEVHSADATIANAGDGHDTVQSSVNFTLRRHSSGDDLEDLVFLGDDDLIGVGNSADNLIVGNAGDNHLSGVWGDDTIRGGDGDDMIIGEAGADHLEGGRGNDSVLGVDGDDTLLGGDGDDELAGSDGNDVVNGDAGNDNMGGGTGDDTMDGGIGNDTMGGGLGDDVMYGGVGDDRLEGGAGDDTLNSGAGNDMIGGSFGDDVLDGGDGQDDLGGGAGQDTIDGGAGDDSVGGGEGDDLITGGDGSDFLAGGGRDDRIDGGTGDDSINGGDGDDVMTGGAGADVFVFNFFNEGDDDVITDYEDGIDSFLIRTSHIETGEIILDNGGNGLQGFVDALGITDTRLGAQMDIDGHLVVVEGVSAADLTLDDFQFI
ncbi:calcium-binding protein [uncultured Roseovarius sp.]|uniref:calcium-binding protein n=1 Tax=uncultured Roseovarius sp. TaxID=293344 RepID=UPI002629FCAE|nr:calcium-binding protein [uncultured Roseovarius sp.]